MESEWWSRRELRDYQEKKLRAIIKHSLQAVPYYQTWLKEHGSLTDKSLNGFELLNELPIVDKETYRAKGESFHAQCVKERFEHAKTSGSTGVALHFPKSLESCAFQRASLYRGHRWHGVEPGDREARLWGIPVSLKGRVLVRLRDVSLNRFREKHYDLDPVTLEDFHRRMLRRRPVYLMGYTSMVSQYAEYLQRSGIDGRAYGLRMVKCTSETIHPRDREVVREVFGTDLVAEYGAAEAGLIAFQCDKGGLHLASEGSFVELIQPEQPLEDSELREVVVTNLDNKHFPVLRYKIGDLAAFEEGSCACGRTLPLLKRVVGRISDVIRSSDGRAWHSIILYYIMKGLQDVGGGVSQFRVEQDALDSLIITVVPDKKYSSLTEKFLSDKCREVFGPKFRIGIVTIDHIPREASGKLRDFISRVGKRSDLKGPCN